MKTFSIGFNLKYLVCNSVIHCNYIISENHLCLLMFGQLSRPVLRSVLFAANPHTRNVYIGECILRFYPRVISGSNTNYKSYMCAVTRGLIYPAFVATNVDLFLEPRFPIRGLLLLIIAFLYLKIA